MSYFKIIKRILLFLKQYHSKKNIYLIVSLIILSILLNLAVPWVFKIIVSGLYSDEAIVLSLLLAISYGSIWTLSKLFFYFSEMLSVKILEDLNKSFCLDNFRKFLNIDIKFLSKDSIGAIMHSLEEGQRSIYIVIYGIFLNFIPIVLELILTYLIILYNYGFLFASIILIFPILYLLYSVKVLSHLYKYQENSRLENKKSASFMNDILVNLSNIYFQNANEEVLLSLNSTLEDRKKISLKKFSLLSRVSIFQSFLSGFLLITLMCLVIYKVNNSALDPSDFLLLTGYFIQFIVPLNALSGNFREIFLGLSKLRKVLNIGNYALRNENKNIHDFNFTTYNISFDKVSFLYEDKKKILDKISFEIREGDKIAIVGKNGAGKSTISKLLCNLLSPIEGAIYIGNNNISKVHSDLLMSIMTIIPQDTFLLNESILNNLLLGIESKIYTNSLGDLMEKLGVADIIESFPEAYETQVGEYGLKLSGGQKKLIGVARGLLKNSKIYLFDESFASLDSHVKEKLFEYINSLRDKIRIFITHDSSLVAKLDKVLFLSDGKLEAFGSHNSLLENNKNYKNFWLLKQNLSGESK